MSNSRNEKLKAAAMSRRQLLLNGGAMAAGAVLFGAGGSLASEKAPTVRSELPTTKWDAEFDVLVIGSGFAALSAAIEARRKGLDVMVVEKMRVLGGNSCINGGLFAVAGSELQKKEGVRDSIDYMVNDMLKAGRGINHVELTKTIAEGSIDAYNFVIQCGAVFKPKLSWLGGHSVARTYLTHNASGSGIVRPLVKTARAEGVFLRTGCKMLDFIVNDDHRIVGIRARDGYRFPDEESGQVCNFRARRGVVLATGGFSQDAKFRASQDPRLAGKIDSTNQLGATGEAMRAAFRAGAIPVQISLIQLGPWASPDEKGFGVASMFNIQSGFRYGVMVDRSTGKRFVNELADRKTRADAMLKKVDANGTPDYPIIVVDSKGAEACPTLDRCLKYKVVNSFEKLEQLENFYNIPSGGLKKTVDDYNKYVADKNDPEFGKPLSTAIPIAKAPFYAVRGWPKVHHCMGGVQIDVNTHVLHSQTFKPIDGLYAAGEVTGGPHGASRLGSCAITDCLVMGRIAGKSVADNEPV
ncbi:flavocytochrome c [Pseudodesulfovibrio sp.]|uniref:flavocytochrome c n=1 Tax=unclassified Pseudodesulfovibrio TaxID=2661612 RepID=UPI003B0034C0